MDERNAEPLALTPAERDLVRELLELAVHAIELRCPELVVLTIDIQLADAAAVSAA